MNFPKVSIIIINWNGLKDTIECLKSVRKMDYPNYEVVLIDNGSSDYSPEKLKELLPEIILIRNKENLGFTGGNNIGMRSALKNKADYVWLLNNDAVVEPYALSKLVNAGESNPETGLLSPVIYYYSDPDRTQFSGSHIDFDKFCLEEGAGSGRNTVLWGTALLIKRSVIEKIGFLKDKYFAYWEDTDYSLRAINAGYFNKVVKSSKIYHKLNFMEKTSLRKSAHCFYYMARNEYWFFRDNIPFYKRPAFFRKYMIHFINDMLIMKKNSYIDAADAFFDGLYCALCNIGGRRNKDIKMPAVARFIMFKHPYLCLNILEGNLLKIFKETLKRMKCLLTIDKDYAKS